MLQENVERFKEYIERFNGGDVEGALRYAHPEIRFEHRLAELQADVTGIDAVRDWFAAATQIFDRWRIDCDDIRDLGDRVLALGTVRAVGKASGVEVEMPYTVVATFRNGLVARFTDYGDSPQSRRAVGVAEVAERRSQMPSNVADRWQSPHNGTVLLIRLSVGSELRWCTSSGTSVRPQSRQRRP
jgi:ketosteroid isomerase-like protein